MKTVMEIAFYLAWIALFVKVVLVQVKVWKEKNLFCIVLCILVLS